jgi:hypothetical protein
MSIDFHNYSKHALQRYVDYAYKTGILTDDKDKPNRWESR